MDTTDDPVSRAADLARELSSPVRVSIFRHLATEGPTRMRDLAEHLDLPEPLLSNHLRRLRDKHYIDVDRNGRTATYRITDPSIRDAVAALLTAVGAPRHDPEPAVDDNPGLTFARSCYDHVAGELGVRLLEGLLEDRALIRIPKGELEPGPAAEPSFAALGLGMTSVPSRRRLAFACSDWSHDRDHLGGALGAALMTGLISKRWVEPVEHSRRLHLTDAGREGLARYLAA
ncbi:ArsR/SmtB family transcription factor [Rhodococcus sp. NPDC060086]|uniref:ArsR/SmtB family transcription factor n=1 Tax=Rhodococcus sp. NPDC060086 TaxID=3347055 RepID=UPI0036490FE2